MHPHVEAIPRQGCGCVSGEKQLETELAILKAPMTLLITPDQAANGWGSHNPSDAIGSRLVRS